jgi:phage-related protein
MAKERLQRKPLHWIGSSRDDIRKLPEAVKDVFGYALAVAQVGDKHVDAKPMKGFGGAGVLEVVADDAGDTYRAIYTVKLPSAIYVLHVFQKKSKTGIKTPKNELIKIQKRLKLAEEHHREQYENKGEVAKAKKK